MSVNVNPVPQLQIPKEFLSNPLSKAYFEQLNTIVFQLRQRTGGSTDDVEDSKQNITSSSSRVSRNAARINSLELKEFEIVTTTSALTTNRNQIIICKNLSSIDITLDAQAVKDDEVHIKRRNDEVIVRGVIDGDTDLVINVLNFSLHLVFDGTDWNSI